MSKNVRNLSFRKGLEDNLFENLAETKAENGELDQQKLKSLADKYLIGNANTYGAATFYDFLNPEKSNKKVFSCAGSACMLAGTQKDLHHSLEKHFDASEIGEVYCLGRCYENKAFHYNGLNYSGDDIQHMEALKTGKVKALPDHYHVGSMGKGILTNPEITQEICERTLTQL
ncbi:MAG: NAD(P)H-dependent oxidoreductase subunit E, partial [Saprospiraceae bacterium]|nr:NAD(P)H-dependent oxidoreductase subunit E [Saprospiraceae bacterium]